MKKTLASVVFTLCSAGSLPAAVTITATHNTPNGTASGGNGTGVGVLSTSPTYTISTNRLLPVTTYTVSNVNLTSVGGSATESFTFTVTYAQTGGSGVQYSGFGNVAVTGGASNNQIGAGETLTATIALATSSFAELSLTGFTTVLVGASQNVDTVNPPGTITSGAGSTNFVLNQFSYPISGNSVTFTPLNATAPSFQGFSVEFIAVPEPSSLSLLALGTLALLRRRRMD